MTPNSSPVTLRRSRYPVFLWAISLDARVQRFKKVRLRLNSRAPFFSLRMQIEPVATNRRNLGDASDRPTWPLSCLPAVPPPGPLHGMQPCIWFSERCLPITSSFPYVNPDVKKGGKITYGVVGTSIVQSFILKACARRRAAVGSAIRQPHLQVACSAQAQALHALRPAGGNGGMG